MLLPRGLKRGAWMELDDADIRAPPRRPQRRRRRCATARVGVRRGPAFRRAVAVAVVLVRGLAAAQCQRPTRWQSLGRQNGTTAAMSVVTEAGSPIP